MMKNITQDHNINKFNHLLNLKKTQAKILSFSADHQNHYFLKLRLHNLRNDNYRLVLLNNQLTVMLFESIEFNKPVHLHNYSLNELLNDPFYDEFKSININLPEDDFYLIHHKVISPGILKITFGKINHN